MALRIQFICPCLLFLLSAVSSDFLSSNDTAHVATLDLTLSVNLEIHVTSPGFPSCCEPAILLVECTTIPCFIRMQFSDLDIPYGSKFLIHDGMTKESPLLDVQPELINGVWHRPVVASLNPRLLLEFYPDMKRTLGHAGFKAQAWAVNSPPTQWKDKPTSGGCGILRTAVEGRDIHVSYPPLESVGYEQYNEVTQDCVWVLRPPERNMAHEQSTMVYIRFIQLSQIADLEILEGTTSLGRPVEFFNYMHMYFGEDKNITLDMIEQASGGVAMISSNRGLYIRATIFNNRAHPSNLTFVYGVAQQMLPGVWPSWCDNMVGQPTGFWCSHERTLCLPVHHLCNGIPNCPHGEDEATCNKASGCDDALLEKECEKGVCVFMFDKCPEEPCSDLRPFLCSNNQKCLPWSYVCDGYADCDDQSDEDNCEFAGCHVDERSCLTGECVHRDSRCPEDACSDNMNRCSGGRDCFWESQRCDGFNDCMSGIDEENCYIEKLSVPWEMSVGVVGVAVAVVCIFIIYLKRRYHKHSFLAAQFARSSHIGSGQHNTHVSAATYDALAMEIREYDDDSSAGEAASPPPPYEVALENSRPVQRSEESDDEPPPPTYESVTARLPHPQETEPA